MKEITINSKIIIQIPETKLTEEITKEDAGIAILDLEQHLNSMPKVSSHKGLKMYTRFHFDTSNIEKQL